MRNVRINRFLASTGISSRRGADEIILQKRVKVNGSLIELPGVEIDPEVDTVEVDNQIVKSQNLIYKVFNKPRGVITTLSDPQKRRTISDYIDGESSRLFPVGRLDFDVAGVLLLTNDGELAQKLLHPKFEIQKRYLAELTTLVSDEQIKILEKGFDLGDGFGKAIDVKNVRPKKEWTNLIKYQDSFLIEIIVTEGRKHFVKRLILGVGLKLITLSRIEFGEIKLKNLGDGELRELTSKEVSFIKLLRGRAVWFSSSGS